jgi:polysaccharide deacetylase 2 family uncharacterized protein YibQ
MGVGRGAMIAAAGAVVGAAVALAFALHMPDTPAPKPPTPVPVARSAIPKPQHLPPPERTPLPRPETAPAPPSLAPSAAQPAAPRATPTWLAYAEPAPPTRGRPMIAIVIDDMGLNRPLSRRAVALRGLTLSYLPYGEDLPAQTAEARAAGHELLVHVPMAPEGHEDPGPHALLPDLPPAEIARRLDWNLGRFSGYVGINNHMGSRFTADEPGMTEVLERLKSRGLLFLDSRTTAHTVGPALAHRLGVPLAERNVFLDNVETVEAVRKQLTELEVIARREGAAVAIGHPKEATLAALGPWLASLEAKGLVLVPLSAIVRRSVIARG